MLLSILRPALPVSLVVTSDTYAYRKPESQFRMLVLNGSARLINQQIAFPPSSLA
jgi:hypothetical protein